MGAFDERDLGVFTSRLVRDDEQAILLVFHEENGDWQFLSSNEEREEEIVLVHLSHVLDWDPTVRTVEDLPGGWKAWRESVDEEWNREPTPPDQTTIGDSRP